MKNVTNEKLYLKLHYVDNDKLSPISKLSIASIGNAIWRDEGLNFHRNKERQPHLLPLYFSSPNVEKLSCILRMNCFLFMIQPCLTQYRVI